MAGNASVVDEVTKRIEGDPSTKQSDTSQEERKFRIDHPKFKDKDLDWEEVKNLAQKGAHLEEKEREFHQRESTIREQTAAQTRQEVGQYLQQVAQDNPEQLEALLGVKLAKQVTKELDDDDFDFTDPKSALAAITQSVKGELSPLQRKIQDLEKKLADSEQKENQRDFSVRMERERSKHPVLDDESFTESERKAIDRAVKGAILENPSDIATAMSEVAEYAQELKDLKNAKYVEKKVQKAKVPAPVNSKDDAGTPMHPGKTPEDEIQTMRQWRGTDSLATGVRDWLQGRRSAE